MCMCVCVCLKIRTREEKKSFFRLRAYKDICSNCITYFQKDFSIVLSRITPGVFTVMCVCILENPRNKRFGKILV